jgi:hypothetical protein
MLSLSPEYIQLLHASKQPLSLTHELQCPPILPLAPFAYTLLGRLSSLGTLRHGAALVAAVRDVNVKTALKKSTPRSSTGIRDQLTPSELTAVADAAKNPPWLPELASHVLLHPNESCRYVLIEDQLHENSISRFHFLVKRERVAAPVPSPPVPAASSITTPNDHPPKSIVQYRYFIQDLGSLNGLYIDNEKVRHAQWSPLHEGARLRFAPQTRTGRNYLIEFERTAAANLRRKNGTTPMQPQLPSTPLTLKDMHMELMFSHKMNDACIRRVIELDAMTPSLQMELDNRLSAIILKPHTNGLMQPASGLNSAAAAVDSSEYHQNSASLAAEKAHEASKSAFYGRFVSKLPAAAKSGVEQPSMDLDDLNAAPLPSNYAAVESAAAAAQSLVKRKRTREATVSPAPMNGTGAAAAVDDGTATASKRPRNVGKTSAWIEFGRANRSTIRDELQTSMEANGAVTPTALYNETTRELSARWRNASADEKALYAAKAISSQQEGMMLDAAEEEEDVLLLGSFDARRTDGFRNIPIAANSAAAAGMTLPSTVGPIIRDVVQLSSDDEHKPIRPSQQNANDSKQFHASRPHAASVTEAAAAAASAAAASVSASVAVPPIHPHAGKLSNPAFEELLEEYTCGICSDIIYQCVVLDCAHSYCKSCISEWFRKKKMCPVCRTKHKGTPRSVRVADTTIEVLVKQFLLPAARAERLERINRINAEQRESEASKAQKEKLKLLMQKHVGNRLFPNPPSTESDE